MNELIAKIADILEEDSIDVNKRLTDYEGWDSLAGLTLLALIDSNYKKQMRTQDLLSYDTIGDLCAAILA